MDSFLVSGRVGFVSRTDGVKLSEVELEGGRGWLCFAPEEFLPKKGEWIEAKGYLREGTDGRKRKVVQYWRGLTRPEVESELERENEELEARGERVFVESVGVEGKRFKACWLEALRILGVKEAEKFKLWEKDDSEFGLVAFKVACTLYLGLSK